MNCHLCNVTVQNIEQHNKTVGHQKMIIARQQGIEIGIAESKIELERLFNIIKTVENNNKILVAKIKERRRYMDLKFLRETCDDIMNSVLEHSCINLSDLEITKQNNTKTDITCSICIDKIHRKEQMIRTTCNHKFHPFCYLKWADAQKEDAVSCPICREITHTKEVNPMLIEEIRFELHHLYNYF